MAVIVVGTSHLSLTELGKLVNRDASALGKAAQRMLCQSQADARLTEAIEAIRGELNKCPNV